MKKRNKQLVCIANGNQVTFYNNFNENALPKRTGSAFFNTRILIKKQNNNEKTNNSKLHTVMELFD